MVGNLRNHLDVGAGLRQDELVDAFHVGRRQVNERLDRRLFVFAVFQRYHYAQHRDSCFIVAFDNRKGGHVRQEANCPAC
ncbi:hypothetical protein D3C87_1747060 [compost metagenome]